MASGGTGDCQGWITYSAGPNKNATTGVWSGLGSGGPGPVSAPSTAHDYLGDGGTITAPACRAWAKAQFKANVWSNALDTCKGTAGRGKLPAGDGETVWVIYLWGTGATSYTLEDGYNVKNTPPCQADPSSFVTGSQVQAL
jgi:hypothetical protein